MSEHNLKIKNPSWWHRRPKTEKCLFIIVGILIILIIAVLCVQTGFGQECNKNLCLTPTCVKIANSVLDKVDLSVNPCEDFYDFACGNFIKNTEIPEDKAWITSFSIVKDVVEERMQNLLEKPVNSKDIKAFVLAKSLYQSCMNETDIENNSVNEIKRLIKEAGGWPVIEKDQWNETDFDWVSTSYKFMDNGFEDFMFLDFQISADPNNSSRNALILNQVDPDQDKIKRNGFNETIFQEYYKYMVNVAKVFGADNDTVSAEMKDLANFIIEMARITVPKEERRNSSLENNPMTILSLEKKYPYIPWLSYINTRLDPYKKMSYDDILIVKVPSYYEKLGNLLNNTSKRTISNYMFWSVIESRMSNLNDELRNLELEFLKVVSGVTKRTARRIECTETVIKLYVASGALYVRNYVRKEAKQTLTEMIKLIQDQFTQNLVKVDWMDPKTKSQVIEKAEAIHLHMAYPDELLDDDKLNKYYKELEFSATNYLGNMLNLSIFKGVIEYPQLDEVMDKKDWRNHAYVALSLAFYDSSENSIEFLAAILQNVFFDIYRPKYMNFGAIGTVVGHEITHGFDDEGRQYDKHGNVVDWWDPKTKESFDQRTQCIVDQYGNITVPEINMNLNGITTQGENIADNAGIKLAYLAYKEWSKKQGPEPTLPGLPYTPDQMFWISTGNMWCEVMRKELLENIVRSLVHAPARYRINVPFMNSEYFAKDFKCATGTKMNPKQKCHVW